MQHRANRELNKKFVQSRKKLQGRKPFLGWLAKKIREVFLRSQSGQRRLFHWESKTGFRANGVILPLALRPGLFMGGKSSANKPDGLGVKFLFAMIVLCLASLGGIFVGFFSGQEVSASSVTLTIPANALSLDISPNSGTVFQKSTTGTINVATDSSYGYSLSIKSKNTDGSGAKSNDLLNGSNKIASIVSALNESDFQSSATNNTWGYLPSKLNSSTNSDFQPGPTFEPTTLDVTDSSSAGTDYGIALATKIDSTLPAGTYHNTFVLTTTTNDPPYDDIIQNWSGCGDLPEETKTLTLLDTRDNKTYTVAKLKDGKCWMTKNLEIENYNLISVDSDVVSDFQIPASTDNPNSNNSLESNELYIDNVYGGYYTWYTATVGEGNYSKASGDVSHSICPKGWRLPTSSEYKALNDALGGNTNSVGVTMLQSSPNNFKMGGYYSTGLADEIGNKAYYWSSTAYNSDGAYYLLFDSNSIYPQQYDKFYGTKYRLYSMRCVARYNKKVGTLQDVTDWADSIEEGETALSKDSRDDKEYTVARLVDGKLWMTQNLAIGKEGEETHLTSDTSDTAGDFTLPASSTNGFNTYDKSFVYIDNTYGGYYSWFAATAGEGTQSKSSGDVSHSICPKGWRLPTQTEYSNLVTKLGGTSSAGALQASPNNFKKGGYYNNGSPNYMDSYGYYWTASAWPSNNNLAYLLSFNDSSASSVLNDKHNGQSVRCVARIDDPTMQNVEKWGDSVKSGETKTVSDTRDGKQYIVARLADGKLWMTQNLAIGKEDSSMELTSVDSDIASSFTLPSSDKSGFSYANIPYIYLDNTYGGYYSWFAATAGEGTQSKSSGDVYHSICPKGWKLPTLTEYSNLVTKLGGTSSAGATALQNSTNNFKKGGRYIYGSSSYVGSEGLYWSASAYPSNDSWAYYLYFIDSSVNPAGYIDKYYGLSVRCVARQ